jgi:hypothetical protein
MENYKRYEGSVSWDLHELKTRAADKHLCLRCLVNSREEVPVKGAFCPLCGAAWNAKKTGGKNDA